MLFVMMPWWSGQAHERWVELVHEKSAVIRKPTVNSGNQYGKSLRIFPDKGCFRENNNKFDGVMVGTGREVIPTPDPGGVCGFVDYS